MRTLCGLFLLLAVSAADAQTPADSLRGTAATILAKDLPEAYRAVALASGDGALGGMGLFAYGFVGNSTGGGTEAERSALFFSLMGATFVDPDEFAALLDGKRARIRGYALDLPAMMRSSTGANRSQIPAPIFSETWIEAGRIQQWSPRPALSRDAILKAFDGPPGNVSHPAAEASSLSNVKQIGLGFIMYSADYDDHFPKADSTPKAKALVMPYIKSEEIWKSPSGGGYLYNTALSGVSQTAIEDVAGTPLVWQEKPFPDGSRAVAFTDGHAKKLDPGEWDVLLSKELRRRQKAKADAAATKMKATKKAARYVPDPSKGQRKPR